jgi:hypothetical protein
VSEPTFLGLPIVCNDFTTCRRHAQCRLFHSVPKRDNRRSKDQENARQREMRAKRNL